MRTPHKDLSRGRHSRRSRAAASVGTRGLRASLSTPGNRPWCPGSLGPVLRAASGDDDSRLSRQGEGGSLKDTFREGPRCLTLCWGRGWGRGHARALPPNTHGRKTTSSFILQVREKFMLSSQHLTWLTCIRKPGFRCEYGLAADPLPLATLPCPLRPQGLSLPSGHTSVTSGAAWPQGPPKTHGLGVSGATRALLSSPRQLWV